MIYYNGIYHNLKITENVSLNSIITISAIIIDYYYWYNYIFTYSICMHVPNDKYWYWFLFFSFNDVHSSYKTVLSKLGDPYYAGVMAAASGVFQQKGLSISDKYKRALDEFYSSTMQLVDFLQQPQGAVDAINAWASNVTHGNFSSLIQQPLDPSARLLVVNGLAFRSQWLFRFDPAMTFDKGLFYTTTKKRCSNDFYNTLIIFSIAKAGLKLKKKGRSPV